MQPHRFTTYERDQNGSDEAMHRRYNSVRTRFDQPDPYEGSYELNDPQSFNRYSYVQNDPVNFVDPSGLVESWNCSAQYSACGSSGYSGTPFSDSYFLNPWGDANVSENIARGWLRYEAWLAEKRRELISTQEIEEEENCGVNPITGQPGFTRNPVGQPGHLRAPVGGQGQWQAPRGRRLHQGLDVAGTLNVSPVYANRAGTVEAAGWGGRDAGYRVRIDHGDGVITRSAHLQQGSIGAVGIAIGDRVEQGQQIGTVGNTGNAQGTPPHVHFGVSVDGVNQDPEEYLNSPCP